MEMLNHNIKILYQHRTHVVFFTTTQNSSQIPDLIAQKICKKLLHANKKGAIIQRAILICDTYFQHKKLPYTETCIVSFLIENKSKQTLKNPTDNHHHKNIFTITKISIQQKDTDTESVLEKYKKFLTFQQYLFDFKTHAKNKVIFNPYEIFELIPVSIPKPWGQEIWFSGVETRGVSRIKNIQPRPQSQTESIPLSWMISCVPRLIFGKKCADKDPVLIKILDPLHTPIIGDLYYELHLEKNEVYVVLDVPKAGGKIKIGINEKKLAEYSQNKTKYKEDFLNTILEYENVRRKIDTLTDQNKQTPDDLFELEKKLRDSMDEFCGFMNLHIGDVVNVPIHTPHALQHGVKVLEFQTPTYERLIISFAQKVLTQQHWDTRRAFDIIKIEPFKNQTLKILSKTKNILKELVCKFSDFFVARWTLYEASTCKLSTEKNYNILFLINGTIRIQNTAHNEKQKNKKQSICIKKHQCLMIPPHRKLVISSKKKCVFLICIPIN